MAGTGVFLRTSAALTAAVLFLTHGALADGGIVVAANGAAAAASAGAKAAPDGGAKNQAGGPDRPYAVSFDANGGTVTPTSGATGAARTLASLPVPVRNGYSFGGWFTDTTGGAQVTPATEFGADAAVYARWTLVTHTVTFDAAGGSVSPAAAATGEGAALASLPTPSRAGYAFAGWFTAPTGGAPVTTHTTFSANATVYARWTLLTRTVTFNASGGTVTPTTGVTGEDAALTLAPLPVPVRAGYTFDGWFTAPTGGDSVTAGRTFSANATVYARWKLVTYTIRFDASGGAAGAASGTTGKGWKLASLPEPSREGYAFAGWFTAPTGGSAVTTATTFSANATVYARWTLISYNIRFDATGGKASPESGATGEGWKLASLPTPARSGYTFEGWFTAASGGDKVTAGTAFRGNATVYARWAPVVYTVRFDAGGGAVKPESGATGEGWKLASLPTPARHGYTFDGWFTAATGGSQVAASRVYGADATVYARWTLVRHRITFDANITGGKVSPASAVTGKGWKLASLPTPAKDCYTFDGWFTAPTGGDSVTANTAFGADATVYARWRLNTYTVRFDAAGGTAIPASGRTGEGCRLASLPEPSREGYTFAGWFAADTGGAPVTAAHVYGADATIHARWTLVRYTVAFDANITGGKVSPASAATGDGWKLASLPTPVKDGYTFVGWYTSAAGGAEVTGGGAGTAFRGNATVYARWEAVKP